MQGNKFNAIVDGQWGSTGKGLMASGLADKYRPDVISTTNMANAGHTAVDTNGTAFIAKALPSPSILNKWRPGYKPITVLGSTAAFHIDQLMKEIAECRNEEGEFLLAIHPRAGVITEEHRQAENDLKTGTKHIASTMQGCGTFLADKVMRRKELKLARDYPELEQYVHKPILDGTLPEVLLRALQNGTILHEGSQGFSLDVNHGSHYPACTSRSTTATQNIADMGLPAQAMGDVYLVIRPYPIRVGNVVENGETVGYSGDCYYDHKETSWDEVAKAANAPPEVTKGELTTVTKRLRRVFTFSKVQLQEAIRVNGATKIALNFANYIDWDCYGCNVFEDLPQEVHDFVGMIENVGKVPVALVGTGPQVDHICYRDVPQNSGIFG
jgi:adenylosuccinate synthase